MLKSYISFFFFLQLQSSLGFIFLFLCNDITVLMLWLVLGKKKLFLIKTLNMVWLPQIQIEASQLLTRSIILFSPQIWHDTYCRTFQRGFLKCYPAPVDFLVKGVHKKALYTCGTPSQVFLLISPDISSPQACVGLSDIILLILLLHPLAQHLCVFYWCDESVDM